MTATDAITSALEFIRVVDPGEGPSTTELNDGLTRVNDMLANWLLEGMNLTGTVITTYSLVSGTSSYTLGVGGSLDTARPLRITAATILQPAAGGGNVRVPLKLLTEQQWAELQYRDSLFATNPTHMFYNALFPTATLNLHPVPTFAGSARSIEVHSWSSFALFPDLVTVVSFPPGYERAIRYNLAIELCGSYAAVPDPQVVQIAAVSKAALRALNSAPPGLQPAAGPTDALIPANNG